jgi:hypothetical protein
VERVPDHVAWLPALARARNEGVTARTWLWHRPFAPVDLIARDPDDDEPLAAVVLHASVLRRDVELRSTQVPKASLAKLARAPKPATGTGSHVYLVAHEEGASDCDACELRRGEQPCSVCGGTGKVVGPDQEGKNTFWRPCGLCKNGFVTCTTCDGAGDAVRAQLGHVRDVEDSLRYTYFPSMDLEIELKLGALVSIEPPDCLLFEPETKHVETAYRGAADRIEPAFHGHRFGDALPRARTAAAGVGGRGEVVKQTIRTYAWPLRLLRYRIFGSVRTVVLVVDAGRRLHAVVA